MPGDADTIGPFLARAGWAAARRAPLAGDASHRRYDRLTRDGETAVLMIAPPETGEDTRPFLRIAQHLGAVELSAPEILAAEPETGLLLLEDLGDALIARIADDPEKEHALYAAAVDVLVHLHRHPVPEGVAAMDAARLCDLAALPWTTYCPGDPAGMIAALGALLSETSGLTDILALRDYHAENLIWLPERTGPARVGLLDFQDAVAGHRAYDLVSLLEDARRDVAPDLREAMIDRYLTATGTAPAPFRRACAVLGVQRHLRILGIFARLCVRDGKPGYLRFMPRVWSHLARDLAHPDLAELQAVVLADLPAPDAAVLTELEARCAPTR